MTKHINRKLLIYVAGPYTSPDPVKNTKRAIEAGLEIAEKGYAVFIPHLNILWDLVSCKDYEFILEQDLEVVTRCDAIFRLKGYSLGADREVRRAQEFCIPVLFEEYGDMEVF